MTVLKSLACGVLLVGSVCVNGCACFVSPQLTQTRHIARKGDTLSKLAVAYYGSENKVGMLISANPELNPGAPLSVGTRVDIPVD